MQACIHSPNQFCTSKMTKVIFKFSKVILKFSGEEIYFANLSI